MFSKTLTAAFLAIALLASAGAQGRRDSRAPSVPPPVVSQVIAVQRGGKITIPLGIHGVRGEQLEFLIRTPPAHGKLTAVKSTGVNSAAVIYTPSAKGAAAEDRFSYAVRGSEGVSAPGVIAMRFVEPIVVPAKMRAPSELEFPPVFPGQRSTVELEIANEGGGFLEGEVTVPEPWSIEGLRIFKIAAGKSSVFKLTFTPAQPGVRTGEAVISGAERKVIPLRASAEERLTATPAQLKLTAQPGNQTRMGVLKIANHSEEDAQVGIEAGPRLLTDRSVKVPAHGTAPLPVFADAAEGAAFDDTVKLSSNEWKTSVAVHAVAVGAILKFSASEVSMKGGTVRTAASGTAVLENSGGEAITVRLDLARPFEVETRVVTAPARGSVEIPVLVRDSGPGKFSSSMRAIGEGGSAAVQLTAEIADEDAPQGPRTTFTATGGAAAGTTDGNALKETDTPPGDAAPIPQNAREIPNVLGKFGRGTGTTTAVLDWPAQLGPVQNARVEERVLSLADNGDLQIGWAPIAEAAIAPAADRVTAELRGLKPATFYTVRVVTGKDADAAVLFTTDFRTAAAKPFFSGSLRTPMLVLALLVLLYAVWRSRRVPRQAEK